MMPTQASKRVILDRIGLIDAMLAELRALPAQTLIVFTSDSRTPAAAESFLRRCLEALLDTGRHILAKAFAKAVVEYKDIPRRLKEYGVLADDEYQLLFTMAGYRNCMVHFYHEVTTDELYQICTHQLGDIERVALAYRRWMSANPQLVSDEL